MLSLYMISIRFSNYVLFSANIIHNLQNPGRVRIHVLKGGRCRIYVFFLINLDLNPIFQH